MMEVVNLFNSVVSSAWMFAAFLALLNLAPVLVVP